MGTPNRIRDSLLTGFGGTSEAQIVELTLRITLCGFFPTGSMTHCGSRKKTQRPRSRRPNRRPHEGGNTSSPGGFAATSGIGRALSSAWPLTKIALAAGSTPSCVRGGSRRFVRADRFRFVVGHGARSDADPAHLPAMFAIGGLHSASTSPWRTRRLARVPAFHNLFSWRIPRQSGSCRCRLSSCASGSPPPALTSAAGLGRRALPSWLTRLQLTGPRGAS